MNQASKIAPHAHYAFMYKCACGAILRAPKHERRPKGRSEWLLRGMRRIHMEEESAQTGAKAKGRSDWLLCGMHRDSH